MAGLRPHTETSASRRAAMLSFYDSGMERQCIKAGDPFFCAFLRRTFQRWGWWGWRLPGCFLVEEIQVPILWASAPLELAQRAPCRRVRGRSQGSTPCSGASGSRCCFQRWAGHSLPQVLKLENDRRRYTDPGGEVLRRRRKPCSLPVFLSTRHPGGEWLVVVERSVEKKAWLEFGSTTQEPIKSSPRQPSNY